MTSLRHRLGVVAGLVMGASAASGQGMPTLYSGGTGAVPMSPPASVAENHPAPPLLAAPGRTSTSAPGTSYPSNPTDMLLSPRAHRSNTLAFCQGGSEADQCCGPVGANGPITYELFARTGPNFIVGGSSIFSGAVDFGWKVALGGRTLFFTPERDRAWYIDLGGSFTYNDGDETRMLDVFTPADLDATTGRPARPDELHPFTVRGLYRSAFDFALGRDWFLNGPGVTGAMTNVNRRLGVDVGGSWGYSHVDLIPVENPAQYLRKSGVYHAFTLGTHYDWERPLGSAILFGGLRTQWSYNWMNIIPPQDSNLSDVSILMTLGLRY